MKKINLELNYSEIKLRIEAQKKPYRPGIWADMVGVSKNVIANVHGKTNQNPSMEYIISVSIVTGKSVDYYLWGKDVSSDHQSQDDSLKVSPIIKRHQGVIARFKDPERGLLLNEQLIDIENTSDKLYDKAAYLIQGIHEAAQIIKEEGEDREKKNAG